MFSTFYSFLRSVIILRCSIIYTSLLSICTLGSLFAQTTVKGTIRTTSDESVIGAYVSLTQGESTNQTVSDNEGNFTLIIAKGGTDQNYILEIRALGFETLTKELRADELNTPLQIVLTYSQTELQTVEITGRVSKDYNSDYSFSATKIAIKNKELPQAISTITKELITDRQAFQLSDAVKVVSSVTASGFYNHHAIRGISQNEGGQIINGMRTRQFYFVQPLTSNIERVEVIKGPSSVTFSSVDPGGSINMVTKKPLKETAREINISTGSFNTIRGTLDFTGPMNESKTLLYRFNTAYQEAGSYRDLVENRSILISPSFSYIPNANTTLNAEIIYTDMLGYLDRGQAIFGAVAGKTDLNSTPISRNLGATNDFFRSKELILAASLSQKLSSNTTFNLRYMKQTWEEDLMEHRTINAFATDTAGNEVPSLVQMRMIRRQQLWSTDNLNAYFSFNFDLGSTKHKALVGYDYQRWDKLKGAGQNQARGFILKDGTATRRFDPAKAADYQTIEIDGKILPKPNVNYFNLNAPNNAIANPDDYVINSRFAIPPVLSTVNAIYYQHQLSVGKFKLLASLRYEWFDDITNYEEPSEKSFKNERFIPRIGLTYQLNDNINIYTTYLEGFQPQSNTTDLMPSTFNFFWNPNSAAQFDPLISDLIELGTKVELLSDRLLVNAAVYQINQKNILISANDPNNPDLLSQRGADRSRGFEIDITGQVTYNWQIYASYAYIDATIEADDDQSLVSKRKENTPVNSGNLWTRYNFSDDSALKNLGLGLGMTSQGSRIPWFTRDFEVPSFTTLDLALYYTPLNSNVQISINVNNVLDETYWIGAQTYTRLFPGAPRNFMASVKYNF